MLHQPISGPCRIACYRNILLYNRKYCRLIILFWWSAWSNIRIASIVQVSFMFSCLLLKKNNKNNFVRIFFGFFISYMHIFDILLIIIDNLFQLSLIICRLNIINYWWMVYENCTGNNNVVIENFRCSCLSLISCRNG